MTISQLLQGNIEHRQHQPMVLGSYSRVSSKLRRCLIWAAITLVASWIISGHVFAEELVSVPEPGSVTAEASLSFVPYQ